MGFNHYLDPLVNVEGATSISTILLIDVDVRSFSPYRYVPTPWANHTKTIIRGAPSLGNPSCSKLDFSHPSLDDAVATTLPSPTLYRCWTASRASPSYHCKSLSSTGVWSLAVRQRCGGHHSSICSSYLSCRSPCFIESRHQSPRRICGRLASVGEKSSSFVSPLHDLHNSLGRAILQVLFHN